MSGKKRIITCSDGTWNKPNSTDKKGKPIRTNVQKIFDLILNRDAKDISQIKYYDQGIGAEGSWMTRTFQGATGKGIDTNIMDAYKFTVWNYEPGDDIYLFGFSRGAYTARSLGGLIRKCGILKHNNLNLLAEAYQLYRDREAAPDEELATSFRQQNSHGITRIKFIGVWDTVGALGIPLNAFQWINRKKYCFYDTTLSSIIEYAYHAVAVDEKRKNFMPTLWAKSKHVSSEFNQVLEQRWFPGVHSNVGGGYPDEGLADIALQWMIERANATGLAIDESRLSTDVRPAVNGTLYDSHSGIFALTPAITREIARGEVHDSVYERIQAVDGYDPENVPLRK